MDQRISQAGRLIPQMAPLAFEQVIIAGGDDDVCAREIFDWVAPLLAGIPGGRWMSCQLEFAGGEVHAHYSAGTSQTGLCLTLDAEEACTQELVKHLPQAGSMLIVLLSDFASQTVTLLDGIAHWLLIQDLDEQPMSPVVRLFGGFQTLLSSG